MLATAPLTDGRLTFRPLTPTTAPAFAEAVMASAAGIGAWMGAAMAPRTPEAVAAFVDEWAHLWSTGAGYGFAVFEAEERCQGFGFLNAVNQRHLFANLGYWVRADTAGRGIASAVTLRLARFGFETLGLQRLELVIEPANAASRRVAEKVGAALEGHLRCRLRKDGVPCDALMYSLLPSDLTQ